LVERSSTAAIQKARDASIVVDPDLMSGKLCFRSTRVPFRNLIDYLEGGDTVTRELAVQSLEEANESLLARIRVLP